MAAHSIQAEGRNPEARRSRDEHSRKDEYSQRPRDGGLLPRLPTAI